MRRHRLLLLLALLGLSAVGATCKGREAEDTSRPTPAATPTSDATPIVRAPAVPEMEGVEIGRVPGAYRADALRLLNETFCYCGCTRTVASCLASRAACTCVECSDRVAEFVIASYENGLGTEEVESRVVEAFSEAYNAKPHAFDLTDQPSLGPADAPYTIVEFADFRCPHCRDAFGELTSYVRRRSDVRLVYYYFPLSGFGEPSLRAARAAEAARVQGKFWEMATLLYDNPSALEKADLLGYAKQVGLDLARFEADLEGPAAQQAVMADKSIGSSVGIQATPALFVNGRPLGLPHAAGFLDLRLTMEADREACD